MKLQLYLSHNGVCSRRKAMEIIQAGRVTVNGKSVREPSTDVDPSVDAVTVNGQPVAAKSYDYVMLNKPKGYVTTKEDVHAEKTVLELLPQKYQHLAPVGRLDQYTEGLLLLTNDGQLAFRLTHPKFDVDKTYFVQVIGALDAAKQGRLEKGIELEGKMTAPCKIDNVRAARGKTEFLMTIHEGRKRQVRMMLGSVGCPVAYLQRVRQGPLKLGDLPTGKWRPLSASEVAQLKNAGGNPNHKRPKTTDHRP